MEGSSREGRNVMSEFKGTVGTTGDRDWKNGIVFYHFTLEGSPVVHSCGSHNPKVEVGQSIKFTENNRKVNTSTITDITAEEADKEVQPVVVKATEPSVGDRIRKQQARRDAIHLVIAAMETSLLPFPKSGKAQDKWDRLLDLIHETTFDLLQQEEEEWQAK